MSYHHNINAGSSAGTKSLSNSLRAGMGGDEDVPEAEPEPAERKFQAGEEGGLRIFRGDEEERRGGDEEVDLGSDMGKEDVAGGEEYQYRRSRSASLVSTSSGEFDHEPSHHEDEDGDDLREHERIDFRGFVTPVIHTPARTPSPLAKPVRGCLKKGRPFGVETDTALGGDRIHSPDGRRGSLELLAGLLQEKLARSMEAQEGKGGEEGEGGEEEEEVEVDDAEVEEYMMAGLLTDKGVKDVRKQSVAAEQPVEVIIGEAHLKADSALPSPPNSSCSLQDTVMADSQSTEVSQLTPPETPPKAAQALPTASQAVGISTDVPPMSPGEYTGDYDWQWTTAAFLARSRREASETSSAEAETGPGPSTMGTAAVPAVANIFGTVDPHSVGVSPWFDFRNALFQHGRGRKRSKTHSTHAMTPMLDQMRAMLSINIGEQINAIASPLEGLTNPLSPMSPLLLSPNQITSMGLAFPAAFPFTGNAFSFGAFTPDFRSGSPSVAGTPGLTGRPPKRVRFPTCPDEGVALCSLYPTYSPLEYDRTPLEPPSAEERACKMPERGSRCHYEEAMAEEGGAALRSPMAVDEASTCMSFFGGSESVVVIEAGQHSPPSTAWAEWRSDDLGGRLCDEFDIGGISGALDTQVLASPTRNVGILSLAETGEQYKAFHATLPSSKQDDDDDDDCWNWLDTRKRGCSTSDTDRSQTPKPLGDPVQSACTSPVREEIFSDSECETPRASSRMSDPLLTFRTYADTSIDTFLNDKQTEATSPQDESDTPSLISTASSDSTAVSATPAFDVPIDDREKWLPHFSSNVAAPQVPEIAVTEPATSPLVGPKLRKRKKRDGDKKSSSIWTTAQANISPGSTFGSGFGSDDILGGF